MTTKPRTLHEMIEKWRQLAAEQMQWSRESDTKHDGANSHTERARARIYRECADDLAALLEAVPRLQDEPTPEQAEAEDRVHARVQAAIREGAPYNKAALNKLRTEAVPQLDDHDPLCSEGQYRGDQVMDCDCAGLIHQTIPDVEETEPRLNSGVKHGTLSVPLTLRREPSAEDFADPRFEVLWELMKRVDVDYRNGLFSGATGNDVCAVLDALDQVGSGTQPLSEASTDNAQERERNDRTPTSAPPPDAPREARERAYEILKRMVDPLLGDVTVRDTYGFCNFCYEGNAKHTEECTFKEASNLFEEIKAGSGSVVEGEASGRNGAGAQAQTSTPSHYPPATPEGSRVPRTPPEPSRDKDTGL